MLNKLQQQTNCFGFVFISFLLPHNVKIPRKKLCLGFEMFRFRATSALTGVRACAFACVTKCIDFAYATSALTLLMQAI